MVPREVLHIGEGALSAQRGAYGDNKDVPEQMTRFAAVAGIGHTGKGIEQADEDERIAGSGTDGTA